MQKANEDIRKMARDIFEDILFPRLPYRRIKKYYDNPKYVNSELCSECKGICCKRCGCHFSPDDFEKISFECLKKEIEKGYISIEYVNGETRLADIGVYILRARNQGAPIVDEWYRRTPCILLGEKGCKLDYNNRPSGGRLLVPEVEKKCHSDYTIRDCCYEWEPHQRVLQQLVEYFEGREIECSL